MISQISVADQILDKIILVDKGQEAPYSGVLIPKNELIKLESTADLKDLFEEKLLECTTSCIPDVPEPSHTNAYYFAGGMLIGMLAMVVIGGH